MRLKEEKIRNIVEQIIDMLEKDDRAVFLKDTQEVLHAIKGVITDDLKREDELDEEVRSLLEAHRDKIAWGDVDYHALFQKTKKMLIRERKMVI